MTAPKIKLQLHKSGSALKLTNDQQFRFAFTTDQPEYDYTLWTNWGTGRFHEICVPRTEEGNFELLLPADSTGLFKLFLRYRANSGEKYLETKISLDVHVDPDWIYDSIVYNVFFRAFGARGQGNIKPGEGGTFRDVVVHMDELINLGINTLYINPFHIIGELYRKYNPNDSLPNYLQPGSPYSIKDPKSIDPEVAFPYGDDHIYLTDPKGQFKKFIDAAHKRGLRVIMDLVFNHTAHDFVLQRIFPDWFLYKEGIVSAEDPYIYFSELNEGKPWGDPKHTVVPFDHGEFSWTDTAQLNWEYMLPPAPNDPPPNYHKKEMYEYFKSIPRYWIKEFGVDGFRCDVAYKIPPDFWYQCIQEAQFAAKEYYPENGAIDGEIIFIAESFHIDIDLLFRSGFTYVYGDYSNKIFSPLTLKGYIDYIRNIGSNDYPTGAKFLLFPECHDFHRTTSKLVQHHLLDDADNEPDLDEKEEIAVRGNISRWVLTACLPGMPMVFTGFEKVEWMPVEHVSYSKINWEGAQDIFDDIQKINRIRHNHKPLQSGDYRYIESSEGLAKESKIFAFARFNAEAVIIVVVNMDIRNPAENVVLKLPEISQFKPAQSYILKDLLTGKIYQRDNSGLSVTLGPGESHIFKVEQDWG